MHNIHLSNYNYNLVVKTNDKIQMRSCQLLQFKSGQTEEIYVTGFPSFTDPQIKSEDMVVVLACTSQMCKPTMVAIVDNFEKEFPIFGMVFRFN